ncbi:hypothetical protein [Geminicoccus harenae]|uniref:hypothetical protein n=1 Tax=Geminicoccus harenae TaxID=2498453 RepID=UPI00168B614C|nr:hypothetical protein [Geminicoccus harenae]
MAATSGTVPAAEREPDFVGMIERHRDSQAFWAKCTVVLALVGLAIAGWGLTAAVGWRSGTFWLGLFIAATAVFPLAELLDRRDRWQGLDRLRSAWRALAAAPDTTPADIDRLSDLIRKTHG